MTDSVSSTLAAHWHRFRYDALRDRYVCACGEAIEASTLHNFDWTRPTTTKHDSKGVMPSERENLHLSDGLGGRSEPASVVSGASVTAGDQHPADNTETVFVRSLQMQSL